MNNETATSDQAAIAKSQALQAAEELRAAAGEKALQLKDAAEARAQQIRDAAGEQAEMIQQNVGEQADQLKEVAEQTWGEARAKADDLRIELEKYVRENPTKSIVATFGIGLFVGLLLRR